MSKRFFYSVSAVLVLGLFALDQVIKKNIVANFSPGEKEPFFGPLEITLVYNPNFAFGIDWVPEAFRIPFVLVMLILFLLFWIFRLPKNSWVLLSGSLILAGGLSNFYDRITVGKIVDYLSLSFWPVFNLADAFVTLGGLLFIIYLLFFSPPDLLARSSNKDSGDLRKD